MYRQRDRERQRETVRERELRVWHQGFWRICLMEQRFFGSTAIIAASNCWKSR